MPANIKRKKVKSDKVNAAAASRPTLVKKKTALVSLNPKPLIVKGIIEIALIIGTNIKK